MKMNRFVGVGVCLSAVAAGCFFYRKSMCNCSHDDDQNVKTEKSALMVNILKEPELNAQKAQKGDMVSVHYTGWLDVDGQPGKQFDSSYNRNQPFEFALGQGYVIEGWDIAVGQMKVGEKRRVFIPAKLGYGARGAGAVIPPHANLIFDIELLEIK